MRRAGLGVIVTLAVMLAGASAASGDGSQVIAAGTSDTNLPTETVWSTPKYLNYAPQLFERLRLDVGPDVELLHDGHHRMTPIEAAQLGKRLEPYRLFWLEDATPAENQDAFRLIRQHTTTPLAVGEVFNTIHDCKHLIDN